MGGLLLRGGFVIPERHLPELDEEDSLLDEEPDIDTVLEHLEELEETVDSEDEQKKVRRTIHLVESISLGETVNKYTTRDVAQTFVGGILLSLPLLAESGVFQIAEWLAHPVVRGIPVFLLVNVFFIFFLTYGLIYWSDFRPVRLKRILGIFPRRLVAVLLISLFTATALIVLWGRHVGGDPTLLEIFGRISVIWAAAAFGGALGDILPGESKDKEVNQLVGGVMPDDGEGKVRKEDDKE